MQRSDVAISREKRKLTYEEWLDFPDVSSRTAASTSSMVSPGDGSSTRSRRDRPHPVLGLDMVVSSPKKLTYEEWLNFPDEEGFRSELIDGEVWVASLPTVRHQRIVRRLLHIFDTYLRAHGGGEILPPVNVRLADDQGVGPDLVFVHEWGDDPLTYHGPPPLVIEVVSDARRERIKRDRYERYGVPEYWAVLPESEQIHIYELRDGRYEHPALFEAPAMPSPIALPDLVVDLGEVFAD